MVLVKVPENREREMLSEFYNNSAFTFEGIDLKDKAGLKELESVLRQTGYEEKDCVGYWFKGSVMNEIFGLTDDNAYSDKLTFLVIPNYYHPFVKMSLGARWFDDIVSNNRIKQTAIDRNTPVDFDVSMGEDDE